MVRGKTKVDSSRFSNIKIAIASPSDVIRWARGEKNEVKKPETINYKSYKPEPGGLFCEEIFGPVKDWECHCGKYKKVKHKGIICEKCNVEVTKSKVRRERMAFLNLNAPVSHIWYLKSTPSPIGLLLDMTPKNLENILYYSNYVVTYKNINRFNYLKPFIQELINYETQQLDEDRKDFIEQDLLEIYQEIQDNWDKNSGQQSTPIEDLSEEELDAFKKKIEALKGNDDIVDRLLDKHQEDVQTLKDDYDATCNKYQTALSIIQEKNVKDLLNEDEFSALSLLYDLLDKTSQDVFDEVCEKMTQKQEDFALVDKRYLKLDLMFEVNIGGAAIKEFLAKIDLQKMKKTDLRKNSSNQLRYQRLMEVVDSFLFSKAKPEWMMLECLPVISPELRPMVQLDGGRFAASDLNDLYRRVINRNNRMQRLRDIFAPGGIKNHERRLLQESIDAVLDNSKKARSVNGSNGRPLKSLSDMLKGKEGRFRKNLLGKRVDYSGRSVIVVGPSLKIYQCGLPKEMALELFKPFVINALINPEKGINFKKAKHMVDYVKPEVWDALEKVITEHPVLLNRAPTLHRLGIQAFEPQLIDGKAIELHPLVCAAFNADFDGDQMAVHVPLSAAAQAEARALMLASHNLFSPANGNPIVAPSQDVVLGCYYLTMMKDSQRVKYAQEDVFDQNGNMIATCGTSYVVNGYINYDAKGGPRFEENGVKSKIQLFASENEAIMAYERGMLDLHDIIGVKMSIADVVKLDGSSENSTYIRNITCGRLIFNTILPDNMKYLGTSYYENQELELNSKDRLILKAYDNNCERADAVSKKLIGRLITECHERNGHDRTVQFLDDIKNLGYKYATKAGMSIAITDMDITSDRESIIDNTKKAVEKINNQYKLGFSDESSRRGSVLKAWTDATKDIGDSLIKGIEQFNQISIITKSGARGSTKQISQLSGMRGLMSDPNGNPIEDLPVTSNFHEGLSVLEYFVSTHGARKGLADTALRTADAGYLTRRLVDVAQDVIVREQDCKTKNGIEITPIYEGTEIIEPISERVKGRTALKTIGNPEDKLTEDIYKFYEPYLFEYEAKDIITSETPNDDTNVTTINTGLDSPVVKSLKHSEWKINKEGEFKYVLKSEISDLFPILKNREIIDGNGEKITVTDIIDYKNGKVVVIDYNKDTGVIPESLTKFDSRGQIDPRGAWVVRDEIISDADADKIEKAWMEEDDKLKARGLDENQRNEKRKFRVWVRSPFTCESKMGICSKCYGKDMSLKIPVEVGTSVGIIAAQSIGEPGTQLTMRTFHTGGVAGNYLTGDANVNKKKQEAMKSLDRDRKTGVLSDDSKNKNTTKSIQSLLAVLETPQSGIQRVGELFEARKPKGKAIICEMDGIIKLVDQKGRHQVWIDSEIPVRKEDLDCLIGFKFQGDLFYINKEGNEEIIVPQGVQIKGKDKEKNTIIDKLIKEEVDKIYLRKKYLVPHRGELMVAETSDKPGIKSVGDFIRLGEKITPGPLDPSQILSIADYSETSTKKPTIGGELGVMKYIVEEIQKVYKSQGVDINDKHVEVIVRQMFRKVLILAGRDTDLKAGQIVDKAIVKTKNEELGNSKNKVLFAPKLYGITDASLNTDSFLSAASFQKTTKVLTDAVIRAKRDNLIGLKENVIIGRLIPAGTGLKRFRDVELLDANGKPLPVKRYVYEELKDKTSLDKFDWKKGAKKCIEELGVKTVGEIVPRLESLSEWGQGVEKDIQDTIRRHIADQKAKTEERNKLLVDTNGKVPNLEALATLGVTFIDPDKEEELENVIDIEETEEISDLESETGFTEKTVEDLREEANEIGEEE